MTISLSTAKTFVNIRMSDGGYRKALTPTNTPILKIDMRKTMGPYTIIEVFSPPSMLKTDLSITENLPDGATVDEINAGESTRHAPIL